MYMCLSSLLCQELGPANGALLIVGGAMKDPANLQRFIQSAGGRDAPIVVIRTVGAQKDYYGYGSGLQIIQEAGLTRLSVLHTTEPQLDKLSR